MRVHHLNCVSSCPLGGALMDEVSSDALRGRLTAHCLLLEGERELVLVDTGFGLHDVADPAVLEGLHLSKRLNKDAAGTRAGELPVALLANAWRDRRRSRPIRACEDRLGGCQRSAGGDPAG